MKGSTFITIIVIATIFIIFSGGIHFAINANVKLSENNIKKTKLYYKAETGIKYAKRWIQAIPTIVFLDSNSCKLYKNYFNSHNTDILSNENILIYVDYSSNNKSWSIKSIGKINDNYCEINYSGITSISPLENCYFNNSKSSFGGNRFTASQVFYGKTYWNTKIPISAKGRRNTTFWGHVTTTAAPGGALTGNRIKSTKNHADSGSNLPFWNTNGVNSKLTKYAYGLTIFKDYVSMTDIQLSNSLSEQTFRGGYTADISLHKSLPSIAYKYSDIIKLNAVRNLGQGTGNVDIIFYVKENIGKVSINGVIYNQTDQDIIAIPKNYNNVYVRGEVTSDISIATESDDIILTGNLYPTEYKKDFTNLESNFFNKVPYTGIHNNHPVNQLKNVKTNIQIGLLAGLDFTTQANIIVSKNLMMDSKSTGIIIAGLFAPNGKFKKDNLQWAYINDIMVYGAFIGMSEGITLKNTGFNTLYMSSDTFLNGYRAPGFKSSIHIDKFDKCEINEFSSNMLKWDVKYYTN